MKAAFLRSAALSLLLVGAPDSTEPNAPSALISVVFAQEDQEGQPPSIPEESESARTADDPAPQSAGPTDEMADDGGVDRRPNASPSNSRDRRARTPPSSRQTPPAWTGDAQPNRTDSSARNQPERGSRNPGGRPQNRNASPGQRSNSRRPPSVDPSATNSAAGAGFA